MPEENQVQHRRRRRPEIQEQPIRIIVEENQSAPDWMVSANDISGAASRRSKRPAESGKKKTDTAENGSVSGANLQKVRETVVTEPKHAENPPKNHSAEMEDSVHLSRKGTRITVAASAADTPTVKGTQTDNRKKQPKKGKGKTRKNQRKKRIKRIIGGVAALVLMAAAVFGIIKLRQLIDIKQTLDRGENVFYSNIYMNDISLEGKTLDEAAAIVTHQVDTLLKSFRIILRTQDGRSWEITHDDLQMQYDIADQLDQVWSIGI